MAYGPRDLYELIQRGDLGSIKKVISQFPLFLDKPLKPFGPPLCRAAESGKLEIVKYLVEAGADVHLRGGFSETNAVEHAASRGHVAVLKYLLSIGGTMDTDTGQQNPLLSAIYNGHDECAKILIDHGIDFNTTYIRPDGSEFNALSHSLDYGREEITRYLKTKGVQEIAPSAEAPFDCHSLPDLAFDWFSENIGKPSPLTLQQILPTENAIEICKIGPARSRPFLTLFTKGLSKIPLVDPTNADQIMHSEIFIQLPAPWDADRWDHPNDFWPIQWLNLLANKAASEKCGLGWPIAVACREKNPRPLAPNTKMDSVLLIPMHKVESNDGPDIHLYQMVPLYPEERVMEKNQGAKALMDALSKAKAPLIVDVNRKNAARKTWWPW